MPNPTHSHNAQPILYPYMKVTCNIIQYEEGLQSLQWLLFYPRSSQQVHSDAFCLILVHWGFDKPLLISQGGHKMKKCSPEKVSLIKCLRIDTLYTQNLDFITHELACSRYDLAKVDFWQIQKLKISLSRKKSHMLIKSTVFNFLHIFQLIQTVLKSNF